MSANAIVALCPTAIVMLSTNTGSRFPPPNPAKDPRRAFFFIFREVLSNILALHLVIEGSSHFGKQTDCGASAFGCQVRRDVRMQIFSGAVSRVHLHALLSWQHGERKSGIIVERSYIFNNTSGKWQCRTWHMCATVKMVKPGGGGGVNLACSRSFKCSTAEVEA